MRCLIAFTLACLTATGCSQPSATGGSAARPDEVPGKSSAELRGVMHEKMVYASALLQGIALRDYVQVERDAAALARLSRDSAFIVQDTLAYRAFSDRFSQQASEMAEHARFQDLPAIESDYRQLTETCFRCHEYVREEQFKGALPGRISMR
ncbi:MAG: hypothetical protein U0572_08755 [Phycisphaerales bacterium]